MPRRLGHDGWTLFDQARNIADDEKFAIDLPLPRAKHVARFAKAIRAHEHDQSFERGADMLGHRSERLPCDSAVPYEAEFPHIKLPRRVVDGRMVLVHIPGADPRGCCKAQAILPSAYRPAIRRRRRCPDWHACSRHATTMGRAPAGAARFRCAYSLIATEGSGRPRPASANGRRAWAFPRGSDQSL